MTRLYDTSPALAEIVGIRHGYFGRQGGVSSTPFDSLNVSETAGDGRENVVENRTRAAATLGYAPSQLASLRQTHSNRVITLSKTQPAGERPAADALVTNVPGLLLGILTADCTPVLLTDPVAKIIGAAHAGWKGATDGIIANSVAAMAALGAIPARIVAAIGPTISQANYEVGPQFMADFLALHPDGEEFFITPRNGREHFDLPGFVASQLSACGVGTIQDLALCTYGAPERYFSHRFATHAGQTTGRQIALIGLEKVSLRPIVTLRLQPTQYRALPRNWRGRLSRPDLITGSCNEAGDRQFQSCPGSGCRQLS
ncbi:peptidoglycan editing factor PgeF [Devosia algicola]|uniref:Purine nucleoside phosphorylase n=1 Tax=Devosia algicola TaxID=3026418 RepID=A0ABY7YT99_9HYPH|nr:peptidoglycan editing factor PgeF [Devosia algicola]WDR04080.1 peptidoglycan editing factor PgeF [Devosia algicola]